MRTLEVVFVCLSLLGAGCVRQVPFNPSSGAMITETQDLTAIRDAIARALAAERYVVEGEQPGVVNARFDHRGISLRLAVRYSPSEFRIDYVDSQGLDYMIDPETNQPTISSRYPRYVQNLDRTIRSELGRPAREAAEALEQQREHERELAEAETERQLAIEQSRQNAETERERLRAQAAQAQADQARANADAEYARRMPVMNTQPVTVARFEFEPRRFQRNAVSFANGFQPDPYVMEGRAAGRISSADLGLPSNCAGYWSARPDEVINLPIDYNYFRIDAYAQEDVTLAIVTPDGQVWCDDDSAGGTNSRLEGQFPAGMYAVYVGTYQPGRQTGYSLNFSAYAAQQYVQQQYVQQPQQEAPPDCRQVVLQAGHHPGHLVHCDGAEPYCAAALIRAGHHPGHLVHCQGVQASCAVTLLEQGQHPGHLVNCR